MVDTKTLNKAEVLLALWRGSRTQDNSKLGMFTEDFLKHGDYVDYCNGDVIKVQLATVDESHSIDPLLYDRDCGEGDAQKAITTTSTALLSTKTD